MKQEPPATREIRRPPFRVLSDTLDCSVEFGLELDCRSVTAHAIPRQCRQVFGLCFRKKLNSFLHEGLRGPSCGRLPKEWSSFFPSAGFRCAARSLPARLLRRPRRLSNPGCQSVSSPVLHALPLEVSRLSSAIPQFPHSWSELYRSPANIAKAVRGSRTPGKPRSQGCGGTVPSLLMPACPALSLRAVTCFTDNGRRNYTLVTWA